MRRLLQFAAAVLLITIAPAGHAQLHLKRDKPATEELSWIWQYTEPAPNGNSKALLSDVRFKQLLAAHLSAPQSFWGKDKTLPDTIMEFLAQPRSVVAEQNRYFIATGCVAQFCPARGMLWIDIASPRPLFVFAATNWIAEDKPTDQAGATYTLWIFSSRALDPAHLPQALTGSIAPWTREPLADKTVEQIANVILVDPDGQPHQLQPTDVGITQPTEQKAQS